VIFYYSRHFRLKKDLQLKYLTIKCNFASRANVRSNVEKGKSDERGDGIHRKNKL